MFPLNLTMVLLRQPNLVKCRSFPFHYCQQVDYCQQGDRFQRRGFCFDESFPG